MKDDQYLALEKALAEEKAARERAEAENKALHAQLENTQAEFQRLSHHDVLTGLPNRSQFEADLKREMARAERHNQRIALIYIDLDFFNKINHHFGQAGADHILKEVAERLRTVIRAEDIVARLGGDEFAVILSELGDIYHDTGMVAQRVIDALAKPFTFQNQNTVVSVSMGIACYPESGRQASILEKNANIALSSAKAAGRGNYQYFTPALEIQHSQVLELEQELHFALEKQEFAVVYQPRFDLQTGRMTGMEALLRWHNAKRGDISPADFIPIAEEAGMIPMIGEWVLRTACQQFAKWMKQNSQWECVLAVNVSPRQLQEKNFIELVLQILKETHIQPSQLELEITESMAMRYLKKVEDVLVALRSYGIQLSIDDFGTGYSSLTRLKELPIQSLKIDKSFVQDIDVRVHDNLIIKSTISLAKDLGLNVVAEGVETQSQLQFLVKNQCPEAQGYYYSKPLTVEQMTKFIETQTKEEKV